MREHLFVEFRLAAQLIAPPVKPLPPYWQGPLLPYWQGPATPPVDGSKVVLGMFPKHRQQWLLDCAWDWRNSNAVPEVESAVHVPDEALLQQMDREAPHVAAIYRQQIADAIDCNRRMKPTRVMARIQQLIVNQYGKRTEQA